MISDLVQEVDLRWRDDLIKFAETGECSDDLMTFLKHDSNAQKAIEAVFAIQAAKFEELARMLMKED